MKSKLNHLVLMAYLAAASFAFAQGSPTETTNPGSGPVFAPLTNDSTAASDTNATATPATNPAASPADAGTNAVSFPAAPVPPTVDVPAANATNTPSPDIIPLIQFVDVPLTAAIENLARQANLNYILDPKITYSEGGDKSAPQPNISIRWENLTAEQALYAVLNNYDLQMTVDPKTKIARISPKDPALPDPLITKVIQLKYASPTNVLTSIQSALTDRRSKVVPDVRTSQLVVVATDKEMSAVEDLVTRLDSPTREVLIEANIMETDRSPSSARGINWSGTLQAQNVSFGNGILSTITSNTASAATFNNGSEIVSGGSQTSMVATGPTGFNWNTLSGLTPGIGFLTADGANAVLSFLNSDSDTKVLSTPRTITLDNETADISVTRASPIINVTAGTANTTGGSSIAYTNLGTTLQVTPRISANNYIYLKVVPEVSDDADTVTRTIGGLTYQADEYDVRKIDTQVLIPSGNTLVMGGLVSDDVSKDYTKVPVLGDIPGLGWAFRSQNNTQEKRNLLIFITPTIVQDADFQPAHSDFLKHKIKADKDAKIGYWDSGKPADWTKPFKKDDAQDEQ
jgi:type II secretory pathway component GspD/PulD (secretin)